jgi:hypothetical protein
MTKNLKIALGILGLLVIVYLINMQGQSQYTSKATELITINAEDIDRFLIQNKDDAIEIARQDSGWVISGNDTLVVKERSIDSFLNKVLAVKKGSLVTTKTEKWATYSVDDSTGTHLALLDKEGNTQAYYVFGRSVSDYGRNYVRTHIDPHVYLTDESVIYYLRAQPTYWGEKPKVEVPAADSTSAITG